MNPVSGTDMQQMGNTLDNLSTSVLNFPLTDTEAVLLEAARLVKFGELQDVQLEEGDRKVYKRLTSQQKSFIETLRKEGVTFLHVVVVHNGYPSQIEITGNYGFIKYRRKIRFS